MWSTSIHQEHCQVAGVMLGTVPRRQPDHTGPPSWDAQARQGTGPSAGAQERAWRETVGASGEKDSGRVPTGTGQREQRVHGPEGSRWLCSQDFTGVTVTGTEPRRRGRAAARGAAPAGRRRAVSRAHSGHRRSRLRTEAGGQVDGGRSDQVRTRWPRGSGSRGKRDLDGVGRR